MAVMDSLAEDARAAMLDLELHRLHYTYSMIDFETFREDYRYVYRNMGSNPHSVAPLMWRNRAVQANMYVLDASDSNLIYLPSGLTREATQLYVEELLRNGLAAASGQATSSPPIPRPPTPAEIAATLAFESPRASRELAYSVALELSKRFPSVPELAKAAVFLQFALEYYLPLALFPAPVNPGQLAYLRHGVDIYRPLWSPRVQNEYVPIGARVATFLVRWLYNLLTRDSKGWKLGRLFFGRSYIFDVPLALDAPDIAGAQSFHVRVVIPPGLRVAPPVALHPSKVFEGNDLLKFASFDESNVYLYLGRDHIKAILKRRDSTKQQLSDRLGKVRSSANLALLAPLKTKFTKPTPTKWVLDFLTATMYAGLWKIEEESKVRMIVSIPLALARGIFPLIAFLWVPAAIMVVTALLTAMTLDIFIASLSMLFVIVLTTGIFAIDRRVLRGLVLAHAMLALAASIGAYLLSLVF